MKDFKEMDNAEYQIVRRMAEQRPLSEYGKFCKQLEGLTFRRNGKHVSRWELFEEGLGSIAIKCGFTNIEVLSKTDDAVSNMLIREGYLV